MHGPYDAIIVTAAASSLPQALTTQLAEGGRLIIPISEQTHAQTMYRFTLQNGKLTAEELGNFAFVPLIKNIDE